MNRTERLSRCLPPRSFKHAHSTYRAEFTHPPAFARGARPKKRGARGEGLRYEAKVQSAFLDHYGNRYLQSPWLAFWDNNGYRMCQPDGLLFDFFRGRLTIIEIKLRHTSDAYYQLRQLYEPVIRILFPSSLWDIRCCEVVKWYDPAIAFPGQVQLRENPEDTDPSTIGIHIRSMR